MLLVILVIIVILEIGGEPEALNGGIVVFGIGSYTTLSVPSVFLTQSLAAASTESLQHRTAKAKQNRII